MSFGTASLPCRTVWRQGAIPRNDLFAVNTGGFFGPRKESLGHLTPAMSSSVCQDITTPLLSEQATFIAHLVLCQLVAGDAVLLSHGSVWVVCNTPKRGGDCFASFPSEAFGQ